MNHLYLDHAKFAFTLFIIALMMGGYLVNNRDRIWFFNRQDRRDKIQQKTRKGQLADRIPYQPGPRVENGNNHVV